MKRLLLVCALLAGCKESLPQDVLDDDDDDSGEVLECEPGEIVRQGACYDPTVAHERAVTIVEVFFGGAGTPSSHDYVVLRNNQATELQLEGWSLCNVGGCQVFFLETLPGGGSRRLHLGVEGEDGADDLFLGTWTMDLGNPDELALVASDDLAEPDDVVDFVRWGDGEGGLSRANVAVDAGLWPRVGAFADTSALVEGDSLQYGGTVDDDYVLAPRTYEGVPPRPSPRGELAGAFDAVNGRVILFGGNAAEPDNCIGQAGMVGDTWAFDLATRRWSELATSGGPSPRARHAMTYDSSRGHVLLFGGRYRADPDSGAYTLYNDLWALDVATDTWAPVETSGQLPSPRVNLVMEYDAASDRLFLFGGNTSESGATFTPRNDEYMLDLATLVWDRLDLTGPQGRLFHHSAVDAAGGRIIVYGGGDENAFLGPFLDDLWAFRLADDTWVELNDPAPQPRISGTLIADAARARLVLFGGHDDATLGNRNDLWTLTGDAFAQASGGDRAESSCSGFCQCPADLAVVDANAPERRSAHLLVPAGEVAVLFGGKSDCGNLDDTWLLDLATLTWSELLPATTGEVCMRARGEGCLDLCR